jgi:hypothetical protein
LGALQKEGKLPQNGRSSWSAFTTVLAYVKMLADRKPTRETAETRADSGDYEFKLWRGVIGTFSNILRRIGHTPGTPPIY